MQWYGTLNKLTNIFAFYVLFVFLLMGMYVVLYFILDNSRCLFLLQMSYINCTNKNIKYKILKNK